MNQFNNIIIEELLEILKQKNDLTELEKDILSTLNKYNEKPFDRSGSECKILENNARYPDIFITVKLKPGVKLKDFSKASDKEVLNNLYMQMQEMCLKELKKGF